MTEQNLPIDMGFAPWTTTHGSAHNLSTTAQHAILKAAPHELKQNISEQTDLNSMYYSGKALSKFATLVYTVNQLGNNVDLAADAFQEVKKSFARFVDNKQQYPLAYDTVWKGVVSTAGYDGDLNQDFGNTAYNDHHFHYGYFIQAAAIIGALDPSWLAENKEWVNMLVRDSGNSVDNDSHFPFSRSFDWYNGHSWAKGLFESYDGKDQESTSEDTMFAYAIKMWGQTTGDKSMEARGNMMLGILGRSLNNYFLMEDDNVNQPASFVKNKVTGIVSIFYVTLTHIYYKFETNSLCSYSRTRSTILLTSVQTWSSSKGMSFPTSIPPYPEQATDIKTIQYPHAPIDATLPLHSPKGIRPPRMERHVLGQRLHTGQQGRRRMEGRAIRQPGPHRSQSLLGILYPARIRL
jgi:endoglucanase Acf2